MESNSSQIEAQRRIFTQQAHPSLSIQNSISLCCGLCGGIAFSPIQCKQCTKLYCNNHLNLIKHCQICKCRSFNDTFQISQSQRQKFLKLKIKCSCKQQPLRYTQYICHYNQCFASKSKLKHNFKEFIAVHSQSGQKIALTQRQNILINLNLNHKQSGFDDEHYHYNLKTMERYGWNLKLNEKTVEHLKGEISKTHKLSPYWTVNLEKNHYFLYDYENQLKLEKAYQNCQQQIELEIDNKKYTIRLLTDQRVQINEFGQMRNVNRTQV